MVQNTAHVTWLLVIFQSVAATWFHLLIQSGDAPSIVMTFPHGDPTSAPLLLSFAFLSFASFPGSLPSFVPCWGPPDLPSVRSHEPPDQLAHVFCCWRRSRLRPIPDHVPMSCEICRWEMFCMWGMFILTRCAYQNPAVKNERARGKVVAREQTFGVSLEWGWTWNRKSITRNFLWSSEHAIHSHAWRGSWHLIDAVRTLFQDKVIRTRGFCWNQHLRDCKA